MGKRLVLNDLNLGSVAKKVNSNFDGCAVSDVLGSLAVSKTYGDKCDRLYKKTKAHIEQNLKPEDIESVLEKEPTTNAFKGEIVAVNTLFGTEYLLGETRWQIRGVVKGGAKNALINAAVGNKAVLDVLIKHGILITDYTIDYDKIHTILEPLKSKADIPEELAILREVSELVETERTVRVSTIKENFKPEEE